MLTQADNELLTRVGPGTPMGAYMRRFWHSIYKGATLAPGGPPKRIRLLGESFVLFRAGDGRLALFDEGCPHRRASLALARNEDCAIRCIFHGWKIDIEGNVVDVPSEPSERERFGKKVRVAAFPVREAGGLIWAFVGAGEPAQFPDLPFTHLPLDHVTILEIPVNCNWLQGVEGQIDSSHVSNLHSSSLRTTFSADTPGLRLTNQYFLADRGPKFDVVPTNYGLRAAAVRTVAPDLAWVRVTEYLMPYWTMIPGPEDEDMLNIGQVPIDDTHTSQFYVLYNFFHPIDLKSTGHAFQSMLNYDGGSFSRVANAENLWTQDRGLIDRGHWSGLSNILHEDIAIAESQGEIADRSREYLGQSDAAITRARKLLIEAVRDVQNGKPARCLGGDVAYPEIYGKQAAYPAGSSWSDATDKVRAHEALAR